MDRVTTTSGPDLASWVRRVVAGAVLIALLVASITGLRVWHVATLDDHPRADMIVVLGAAQYNGKPSKTFKARLEHAKELYDAGVADTVVTSGGKKTGDAYTEAGAGAEWLVAHGVPDTHAIAVPEGRDTLGSVRAVAAQARELGWNSAVVVSDPWHSLRARTMANDAGLDASSSPTRDAATTPGRDTAANYLRETAALLYYRLSKSSADSIGSSGAD